MGRFMKKSPRQVNICFVTGLSGSGKSTIAKKLAKYHKITYVELDYFSFRGARRPFTEKDCRDSGHEIIWKYIKSNRISPSFLVGVDKHKTEWIEAVTEFVKWLETMPGNYVVEGIQCTYIIPANPKWLDYPIIFKGTSMITSLIRGLQRDEIIDPKHIKTTIADILDRLKWFYRSKSGFDNIRNSMIEKDNYREVPDSVWDDVTAESYIGGENMNYLHESRTNNNFSTEVPADKLSVSNKDFIRRSGYFDDDKSVFVTAKDIKSANHYISESLTYVDENQKPQIHTDKLDLSNMTFVKAPHVKSGGYCNNSLLIKDGKKYRVRVETLIYNDRGQILATKRDKPSKYGLWYNLPGGSLEPNKSIEAQAAAEAREEVFAHVKNVKNSGIWFINKYPKAAMNPNAWDYELAAKYGLDYDGAITIVCVGEYGGRFTGKIKEDDKVDWGKRAQFYDPDEIHLASVHRKALDLVTDYVKEEYIGYEQGDGTVFQTVGEAGMMSYDYPINTLNIAKFSKELPALKKANPGKGYRGLIHCKLEQPVAHPVAFVNISTKDGSIQASHGDPGWIGKARAKIMSHIKKPAHESCFVTEETALKNPYNKYGNIKLTRRIDHKQPVKHHSMIKKNVHESYDDFF